MFGSVIGVDFSENFIKTCDALKEVGNMTYTVTTEGSLDQMLVARIDPSLVSTNSKFLCSGRIIYKFNTSQSYLSVYIHWSV